MSKHKKAFDDCIDEFTQLPAGTHINYPNALIYLFEVPESLSLLINIKHKSIYISRRAIKHVVDKMNVGVDLLYDLQDILKNHQNIYVSNKKNKKDSSKCRYILVTSHNFKMKGFVLETNGINTVVTAMMVDIKYIDKKYKKLM